MVAAAELKTTQAGHQGAFSDAPFGEGDFLRTQGLASLLGGPSEEANETLPASVLMQLGRALPDGMAAPRAETPPHARLLHTCTGGHRSGRTRVGGP